MVKFNLHSKIAINSKITQKTLDFFRSVCGGDEVGKFLLYLPCKYIKYELYNLNELLPSLPHVIPVIHGKILGAYKKNANIFYKVLDIGSQKHFTIFVKEGHNPLDRRIYYYFIGKISIKEGAIMMFFPRWKESFHNYVEPVYYKITGYKALQFNILMKEVCLSMESHSIFSTSLYNLNQYNIKDIFATIHNIYNMQSHQWTKQFITHKNILKLLEYTCFFHQLAAINNLSLGTSKNKKYLYELTMQLTVCQRKAIKAISNNLAKNEKTLNFLQGDVGSGKTLVAFITIRKTMINGYSACFMCPTSILAHQHYETFKEFFPYVSCFLLVSGYKNRQYKSDLLEKITSGIPTVFFGTHNLLYETLPNIQYVIIDEQHKFGMEQRKILIDQYATSDVLFLSATPIPRTLFMLQNGQMDLFTLETTPFTRQVTTRIISHPLEILNHVIVTSQTGKVIWINGAIDEVDDHRKGVKNTFEFLKKHINNVYLLHGQMSDSDKLSVINNFHGGVLVATICVETGIDLPNVSLIIIEEAENFGLASLHQLRGRVGRKGEPSECILITSKNRERLEILVHTNDGFKIAEMDLLQRGYGSFFQKQQWGLDTFKSGKLNPKLFKIASNIVKNKEYHPVIVEEFSKFFLKVPQVNY